MKKKIFVYIVIFFSASMLFGLISQSIEKRKIKEITYSQATIEDFEYVKKHSKTIIVKGKKLIDFKKYIQVENADVIIKNPQKTITIQSKTAKFYPKEDKSIFEKDVIANFGKGKLFTQILYIDNKKNIAYNKTTNLIKTDKMYTTGINILINIGKETINLQHPKTVIER